MGIISSNFNIVSRDYRLRGWNGGRWDLAGGVPHVGTIFFNRAEMRNSPPNGLTTKYYEERCVKTRSSSD